jgi:GTPase SAR1 family protein
MLTWSSQRRCDRSVMPNTKCVVVTIPTRGFQVEVMKSPWMRINVICWDVEVADRIMNLWRHCYQNSKALLFVVDSSDIDQMEGASYDAQRQRPIYIFCIGFSRIWGHPPIHKRLKKLRDKHGLNWLRNAMSYHKFSPKCKVNAILKDVIEWNLDCVCQKRCKRGNCDCAY